MERRHAQAGYNETWLVDARKLMREVQTFTNELQTQEDELYEMAERIVQCVSRRRR